MRRALPADAFEFYVALGPARSQQAVADHFKVNKRTVMREAVREKWNERLEAIDTAARAAVDEVLKKGLEATYLRHSKLLGAMASRAARAIQEFPLESGMDGIKAAALVIKLERLISGESTSRTSVDFEKVIRRQHQELLVIEDQIDEEDPDDGAEEDQSHDH